MKNRSKYRNSFSRPYRVVALLMCVLYLGGPLKDPIGYGLHQISHTLEQPASVLGHQVNDNHSSWEHQLADSKHEHVLVDAVNAFFEALDQHDQQQEIPPSMSFLDKHFPSDSKIDFGSLSDKIEYPDLLRKNLSEGIHLIEIPPPLV